MGSIQCFNMSFLHNYIIMAVIKQIIKEFWLPTLLALGWSLFNFYDGPKADWSVINFVNIFGTTFFIIAWFTGQYFRVRKQAKVEHGLVSVQDQIGSLLKSLEEKTNELINYVTGGGSFCYLELSGLSNDSNKANIVVVHQGKHSLYAVTGRIVDLDIFNKIEGNLTFDKLKKSQSYKNIGDLFVGSAYCSHDVWDLGETQSRRFNIFWMAKNGRFEQLLRFKKVNGKWFCATRVQRDQEILLEKVDDGFCKDDIDWS